MKIFFMIFLLMISSLRTILKNFYSVKKRMSDSEWADERCGPDRGHNYAQYDQLIQIHVLREEKENILRRGYFKKRKDIKKDDIFIEEKERRKRIFFLYLSPWHFHLLLFALSPFCCCLSISLILFLSFFFIYNFSM